MSAQWQAARRVAPHAAVLAASLLGAAGAGAQAPITTDDMRELFPRSIGPAIAGGRIHDIEAIPGDPSTLYVASASGGLWKSTNRGHTWTNVFDTMAVSTFGDVALAPSDPRIVYAGTGEQNNRQSSSYGNGVYRSDDGGASWRHLGLEETRHVGRVVVHPSDPDVAYVAALGNLWAPSEARGVYKTRDGGRSWDQVLFIDDFTGVVDLVLDPSDPNTLYAAAYQRLRRTWGFNGGGPGSAIYKTTDGGGTWAELTTGLPPGDKGRIGLAISASNPAVLNALVEVEDEELQGTYRTEDGGRTWRRMSDMNGRPMYYSHVFIDPTDEDVVYTLATESHVSRDGGATWTRIALAPTYDVGVHADHHALWIDPSDPGHLYLGGDGGLHESYDGGQTFRRIDNFTVAQLYAITVDMRDPYWIYGGLQDNHSFMGPSETRRWEGILPDDWRQTGFGDGMFWQVDPRDARRAYGSSSGGVYFRYDTRTGDIVAIEPIRRPGEPVRFDWTSPMLLSRHDPDHLYLAGNRLFTSLDRGGSWSFGEDLSRGVDRDTLELMGVRGSDVRLSPHDGTASFGEAVTLDESPLDPRVLWVGLDDGNLQVSRDGGGSWTEVSRNVTGVTQGTYVSRITASLTAPGTAYAAFDGHRDGDFRPYLFRTEDFGASWERLHVGLPPLGPVNDVVEHPDNPATLFVGTEHAVFVSTDAGRSWAKMPNLPTTSYDDLLVHPRERDLVLGTHGRGIWILDDTRALAEWGEASRPVRVFSAGPGTIRLYRKDTSYRGQASHAGTNPVDGVEITYRLGPGDGEATLTVTSADGRVVRRLGVPSTAGTHRVSWDLRHALPGEMETWSRYVSETLPRPIAERGPWVAPGEFTVTVTARDTSASTTVEVRGDPEAALTLAMYRSRETFMLDALALESAIEALAERYRAAGIEVPRATLAPETPEAKLGSARGIVGYVYDAMNGSAVRPGTLQPPTQAQRELMETARQYYEDADREQPPR